MPPRYCLLTETACLEVRGADATTFLNAQLSQRLEAENLLSAPLAAWHDAKGRVRALLRVWRLPDRWVLVTARDGAEELLQRLRRFVLRSAVTLNLAPDLGVAAILDPDVAWLAEHGLPTLPTTTVVASHGAVHWLGIAPSYWQLLGTPTDLAAIERQLTPAPAAAAALAEIRLGIPAITANLVDRFVPQTLNLDELNALAFDKGCYPGQEIIARVQHLGGVKKRLRRYGSTLGTPPAVGSAVLDASGEVVGEVVRSAPAGAHCELLAIVEHTAVDGPLTAAGAEIHELPLPFAVPRP